MPNFRPGFLKRGYPLGCLTKTHKVLDSGGYIDANGYKYIEIKGSPNQAAQSATAVVNLVTVTTNTNHSLSTGDVLNVYDASGWTDGEMVSGRKTITVLSPTSFTYVISGNPGASGLISYKVDGGSREFNMLDGEVIGHELTLQLQQTCTVKLDVNSTKVRISSTWEAQTIYDSIDLMWDGEYWIERCRTQGVEFGNTIYFVQQGILSSATLTSLKSSPHEIIPAPSDILHSIIVDEMIIEHLVSSGATAIAANGNTEIWMRYAGIDPISEPNGVVFKLPTSLATGTTVEEYYIQSSKYANDGLSTTIIPIKTPTFSTKGAGIELYQHTADMTDGDVHNTWRYKIKYHKVKLI